MLSCIFAVSNYQKNHNMKIITVIALIFFAVFNSIAQNLIDPETAVGTIPVNNTIGTAWELNFSDEFNGSAVNTNK